MGAEEIDAMTRKPKFAKLNAVRSLDTVIDEGYPTRGLMSSANNLKNALHAEAENCRALGPSHPREQASLLHAILEALAEKDAEIAMLRAQVTKDANRLDWAAGLVQPDHLRDQLYAWGEQARTALGSYD